MGTTQEGGAPPPLRLEAFFAGRARAWGLFQDRFGQVRRQFEVEAEGRWDGETLVLVEDFAYDDGARERRTWRIQAGDAGRYRGRAEGVIGEAAGRIDGNALSWSYDFALPLGRKTLKVRFDDRMFLRGEDILICLAKVTKFGIRLGDVIMVFQKSAQGARQGAHQGAQADRRSSGAAPSLAEAAEVS